MNDRDDSNNLPTSIGLPRRAVGRLGRIALGGGRRIKDALRSRAGDFEDLLREQLLDLLSTPERVETLQRSLATIGGWAMRRGFHADPNAELLFHFVDWLEERHGRQKISAIVFRSSLVRDPAFVEAIAHLATALGPASLRDEGPGWDLDRIEGFKDRAGDRLLDFLVQLAALEADEPPPQGSTLARIDYFESVPIPKRFQRLARMTRGDDLLEKQHTPSRRQKLLEGITDRLRPDSEDDSSAALARFIPGVGDETLHFLVFSTTFFLQSYLLRGIVDALPDLASEVTEQARADEMIDINDP